MTATKQRALAAVLLLAVSAFWQEALGQTSPTSLPGQLHPVQSSPLPVAPTASKNLSAENPASLSAPQPLFDFKDSDIKFSLWNLMNTLRDQKHEGWVLSAYPDPKTSRPLIGAGFGLDVMATEHPQSDPLNPHLFLEPSSAQLWQAAGLEPDRLQRILDRFDRDLAAWTKKKYRKKIRARTLPAELTEDEATRLLRISAIQSIHNAKAYCRNFDQLTASQQMALSQLVFQMGVNLEEFVQFLGTINGDAISSGPAMNSNSVGELLQTSAPAPIETEQQHWKEVQRTLVESQWARSYTSRATTVIAMFDPQYAQNPQEALRQVEAALPPPVKYHRKKTTGKNSHSGKASGQKGTSSAHHKQAVT